MTPEHKIYLEIGRSLPGAEESQMFGKPCFKVNGKAFMSFFDNEMVFKLGGHAHRDALSHDGSRLFDPSKKGRPMKEWIQVPGAYSERWPKMALDAMEYVKKVKG
jgi:hypothetical protein